MEESGKLISHKIVVDDYMEVTLKIPEVLTSLDLEALMLKSRNLFKLSGKVGLGRIGVRGRPPNGNGQMATTDDNVGKKNRKRYSRIWNPSLDVKLHQLVTLKEKEPDEMNWKKIEQLIGIPIKKCQQRAWCLRRDGNWPPHMKGK